MMVQRLIAVVLSLIVMTGTAQAAELIMVEETYCSWCKRWNEEIGVVYDKTDEGRRAPLRRLMASDPVPADLTFKTRVRYTPTFILIEDGQEVARIEGYPGEDFFWPMLGQMLDRLPPPAEPET